MITSTNPSPDHGARSRNWRPTMAAANRAAAESALDGIARELKRRFRASERMADKSGTIGDPWLAGGYAGISVFFTYLYLASGDEKHRRFVEELLYKSAETCASKSAFQAFMMGQLGVAWALNHCGHACWGEAPELCSIVDARLAELLANPIDWKYHHDIFSGLAGIIVYAAERCPAPEADLCLTTAIRLLEETAEGDAMGACWTRHVAPPGFDLAEDMVDTGVARGVGSVIGALAIAHRAAVRSPMPRDLLTRSIKWLMNHQLPPPTAHRFPSLVTRRSLVTPDQTSWCYGDLGIAAVLRNAGESVGDESWSAQATDLARDIMRRHIAGATFAHDACLCHGSAGSALIFARFYNGSAVEEFGYHSDEWIDRALRIRTPGSGFAGYHFVIHEGVDADRGMLRGAAGVGLGLLATMTDIEPRWDKALLLSS